MMVTVVSSPIASYQRGNEMIDRTTDELAQELADMKWGDSLSKLKIGANEAHELGKMYACLRQQLESVKAVIDDADYPSETVKRICAILYPESE